MRSAGPQNYAELCGNYAELCGNYAELCGKCFVHFHCKGLREISMSSNPVNGHVYICLGKATSVCVFNLKLPDLQSTNSFLTGTCEFIGDIPLFPFVTAVDPASNAAWKTHETFSRSCLIVMFEIGKMNDQRNRNIGGQRRLAEPSLNVSIILQHELQSTSVV